MIAHGKARAQVFPPPQNQARWLDGLLRQVAATANVKDCPLRKKLALKIHGFASQSTRHSNAVVTAARRALGAQDTTVRHHNDYQAQLPTIECAKNGHQAKENDSQIIAQHCSGSMPVSN